MIYFKKTYFNFEEKAYIEAAFRKWAIKRTSLINLEMSTIDIGTDKYFFGFENSKSLFFTRVRTSFERFLPKVIFKLPKNATDFFYGFRLGTITSMVFLLFCFIFGIDLLAFIIGNIPLGDFLFIFLFFLVFIGLIWIEMKITSSRIRKVLNI